MATRATYRFFSGQTAYHHWDGYPQGAAHLLSNALVDGGNLTFDAFIQANKKAEETASHEVHGDTEYRYDVFRNREGGWSIKASKRLNFTDKWCIFYYGPADQFIRQFGEI